MSSSTPHDPSDDELPPREPRSGAYGERLDRREPDQVGATWAVCARHPDRAARMSCGSCGEPVCSACADPAPVGVRCPGCARTTRGSAARTVLGGILTPGPPVVTYVLIGACVLVYVAQLAIPDLTDAGAFVPFLGVAEPWRFVTAMFLHSQSQPLHIVFNMLALWQMGLLLEPALGRARYAALYLLSGLGGSVAYLVFAAPPTSMDSLGDGMWFTGTIGASGAVFGLFGAALVSLRRLRQPVTGMLVLLAVNAAMPLFNRTIAWQAHLGGLVVGVVVSLLLIGLAPERLRRVQWPALAAVLVGLVAIAVIRYAMADTSLIDTLPIPR